MDGKRFGVGLTAGLLIAVGIVATSGALGSLSGAYPLRGANQNSLASLTAATTSSRPASGVSTTVGNHSGPASTVGGGNSSLSTALTQLTTSTPSSPQYGQGLTASNGAPLPSPELASIPKQPLLSNAILLVPFVVAFVLGAVLYRAYARNVVE